MEFKDFVEKQKKERSEILTESAKKDGIIRKLVMTQKKLKGNRLRTAKER